MQHAEDTRAVDEVKEPHTTLFVKPAIQERQTVRRIAVEIVITANGIDLDAPASLVFGRCPAYVLVDTETMRWKAIENPAIDTLRGAGFQAAEFVVERGAQAVVAGSVGPNAFGVLQASGVPVYLSAGGTVREAIKAYKIGRLQRMENANVSTHRGTSGGIGIGLGRGPGMGRHTQDAVHPAPPTHYASRAEEITALRETARELRERLAQVLGRLEQLEKENVE